MYQYIVLLNICNEKMFFTFIQRYGTIMLKKHQQNHIRVRMYMASANLEVLEFYFKFNKLNALEITLNRQGT